MMIHLVSNYEFSCYISNTHLRSSNIIKSKNFEENYIIREHFNKSERMSGLFNWLNPFHHHHNHHFGHHHHNPHHFGHHNHHFNHFGHHSGGFGHHNHHLNHHFNHMNHHHHFGHHHGGFHHHHHHH